MLSFAVAEHFDVLKDVLSGYSFFGGTPKPGLSRRRTVAPASPGGGQIENILLMNNTTTTTTKTTKTTGRKKTYTEQISTYTTKTNKTFLDTLTKKSNKTRSQVSHSLLNYMRKNYKKDQLTAIAKAY